MIEKDEQETTETPRAEEELLSAPEPLAEEAAPLEPKAETPTFKETVISINRVSKVVSGGKRIAFSAVVVVGDGKGNVGVGKGKARDVPQAIAKAGFQAKKHFISVPIEGTTLAFEVMGCFGAGQVLLKPASPGTGVIAGGAIRAVLEACGIKDILTKNLGSSNIHSVINATLDALEQLKTKEEIAKRRGKKAEEI